jgi:regulator of sigma D
MLTKLEQTQQKYGGANTVIDNWLTERQELIVQYCKLAGLPPYENNKALPSNESVNEFCQILIDYLSAGHFEIYDDIVRQCQEHGPDSKALADNIYPQISQTTEVLVAFNDKYSDLHSDQSLKDFDSDLSEMGQVLEQRLELEDELIHTLYAKHS